MTTLIEHARVLLPSIALFAARNSVAKEAVLGLLNNTKTVRNDVVRTLARQSKEWIRTCGNSDRKLVDRSSLPSVETNLLIVPQYLTK